ncbi:hypothetical protein A2631_02850 [Candidatus Daviesbacteria bacterium RIFCSPHIGHO2_01_FULL_44_29]|uniref:Glycosyl transferase family 1 domain-containing protein n=1 Tax=Candidatus Daviesbacteria bacterium RIFCSPHIGHO2_02_FULL_43_12 TaxID=1797776 RepID=A0A1F5KK70_9BACT|nr:MAG: hypothetical protein A2631_02850 [Candidatus Daviesbacteria bacterium RIFCSPHIGHO2_01_FULL_44_29]OGE40824.1 MAG: hypothetical protein A3E86_02500 [Candidatus Daviesbacteria bacterium RIFCSPHIGHO2_12_FULL_47_45]OGE41323.1 MAG: hypothetical protein A3D25_02245 [Candidatus Daviesbacteria bacterium RIFCSPHIGHO2_02_FULL_43_12]OGE69524.1 MAG: hypothetical protein A3B55_03985 [Candidatus Daviesbacteria bacterium RIFCSPLOWO2_01_FULL_43_15]
MYHVISHVVFHDEVEIYGPAHVLERFLKARKKETSFLSLPLDLSGSYILRRGGREIKSPVSVSSSLVKWGYDFLYILKYLLKYGVKRQDVVIAIDPLNACLFALLKPFIGFNLIYYTADYSDLRFSNPVFNAVYKYLDKLSLNLCDSNWCVSEGIVEKRTEQGYGKKAKFLPNTPILDDSPRKQDSKLKNELVYVGRMDENMSIWELLKAIKLLSAKISNIHLTLIGSGKNDEVKAFIKDSGLSKQIVFLGPKPNEEVIEVLKKSGIGIALYSGGNLWNVYGDSMKIREYQYFGLPIITTTIPSNSREITAFKCGTVFKPEEVTPEKIAESVLAIQKEYNKFTDNSYKLALIRMKDKMLGELLNI